ncbi:MAG: DUF4286 family protein [Prevotellaceae bacterium]|jgi:hypothetical protein|nr:DUF4286 family protein [Prevotellaceae bacterium]
MLLFNTTYLVSDKVHGCWLKWVTEEHIPFMLKTGAFSQPQVAKVLAGDKQEGTPFAVTFCIYDLPTLEIWKEQYEDMFKKSCFEKFHTEVFSFTTVLELIV